MKLSYFSPIVLILLFYNCSESPSASFNNPSNSEKQTEQSFEWRMHITDSISKGETNYQKVMITDTSDEIIRHTLTVNGSDQLEEQVVYLFKWSSIDNFQLPPFGGFFDDLRKLSDKIGTIKILSFCSVTYYERGKKLFTTKNFDDIYIQTTDDRIYTISYSNGEIKNYEESSLSDFIRYTNP